LASTGALLTTGAVATGVGLATAAGASSSCATGDTLSGSYCEHIVATGLETWTAPAGTTTAQALLVGGGGGGDGYGGGGGDVKVVTLDPSVAADIAVGAGGSMASGEDTTITQGSTTYRAAGGAFGNSGGQSGNGHTGTTLNGPYIFLSSALGGGGAGGDAPVAATGQLSKLDGGPGLSPSDISGVPSYFASDNTCYGGGGATTLTSTNNYQQFGITDGTYHGTAGCSNASTAGNGGSANSLWDGYNGTAGIDGTVIIRYSAGVPATTTTTAPTTTTTGATTTTTGAPLAHTGANTQRVLAFGTVALLLGFGALLRSRRRRDY
jgi:LPXTG-motif cell wall-anchored protein